jgi:amidase
MRHFKPFVIQDDLRPKAEKIDVTQVSIASIGTAFSEKRFSASELTAACLMRVNQSEPYLNAFIWLNDNAMNDAEKIDAEIAVGPRRGPLHGVPVVLKDNMNLINSRTTAGYAGFASDNRIVDPKTGAFNGIDLMPQADAALVAKLKSAGAIIIGKSNLPDFGLDGLRAQSSHNGDTLNPYDARFAPGASSTGSAAAVAVGMGVVSIGTDTAGSILFPASAQSLVGLKPSLGLVPKDGIFPGLFNHDVAGPIARTVSDAAVVLDAISERGPDAQLYVDALAVGAFKGKRIGLYESGIWGEELHPAVKQHYEKMVEVIGLKLGAEPVASVFADTTWLDRWTSRKTFPQCNAYLDGVDAFLAALGGDNPKSRQEFHSRSGFELGMGTTAPLHALLSNPEINKKMDSPEIKEVTEDARALAELYEAIMTEKRIDALFVPRSTQPLPNIDGNTPQYLQDQVAGTQVNELGLPVITVPAGYLDDGRPIAIDIIGKKRLDEATILSLAFDFEQQTHFRKSPPLES